MGAVWRVKDLHFGRPLAIKVMLPDSAARPEAVARFQREAQITGVLQHPGIPPVVDRGELQDASPFFSMKLIEGKTLSSLLRQRENPAEDLPRFLSVFEQVCHAVGFAHARGIIHRDLKPANVMVGEFGEVQVMDWGLARFIGSEQKPVEALEQAEPALDGRLTDPDLETAIFVEKDSGNTGNTDEAGESRTITIGGQVMGTLAYMPPEQARGQTRLDATADVFALGGILCKILTGRAPYAGNDPKEVYQQVAAGDLTDAFNLLEQSNADEELIALTRRCLSQHPQDRPADAHHVGQVIREYEETTRRKLEQEKTDRAAAEARAVEEQKRRKMMLLAAGTVIALLLALGAGGWAFLHQRAEAQAQQVKQQTEQTLREQQARKEISQAVSEANGLRDSFRFGAAATLLDQAENRLKDLPAGDALCARLQQARKDLLIVQELDRIKQEKASILDSEEINVAYGSGPKGAYATAYRKYGLEIEGGAPLQLAQAIKASPVKRHLLDGLYSWHHWEKNRKLDLQLFEVIQATDVDALKQIYMAMQTLPEAEAGKRIATLNTSGLSPAFIHLLSRILNLRKQYSNSLQLLRIASSEHPSNYWLHAAFLYGNLNLGQEESIGHCYAALAIRPRSKLVLNAFGIHLYEQKRYGEAEQAFRKSLEADPDQALVHSNLAEMYMRQKQFEKAEQSVNKALELDASLGHAHTTLANLLSEKLQWKEAEKSYRTAIELQESVQNRVGLGIVISMLGKDDEAEQQFRKAIAFAPYTSQPYTTLAMLLARQNRLTEAEEIARQALHIESKRYEQVDFQPEAAVVHNSLGEIHARAGRPEEAEKEYRLAIQKDPTNWVYRRDMVLLLSRLGRMKEAEQVCRSAIELDPEGHVIYDLLGTVLMKDKSRFKDAGVAFKQAIELAPAEPAYLNHLGDLYQIQKQFEAARQQYLAAIQAAPGSPIGHISLGRLQAVMGEYDQAEEEYKIAVELDPGNYGQYVGLAGILSEIGRHQDAGRLLRMAIEVAPDDTSLRQRLCQLLVSMKRVEDARNELAFVVKIDPAYKDADLHYDLGEHLRLSRQYALAVKEYQKAIQLDPLSAKAHAFLGIALEALRRDVEAGKAFRKAMELDPGESLYPFRLGMLHKRRRRLDEAESHINAAIRLEPGKGDYHAGLGEIHLAQRQYAAATLHFQRAIELGSRFPRTYGLLGSALAGQENFEDASQALQTSIQLNPRDAFTHHNLARVLLKLNKFDAAERAYRKAIELNPNHAPFHNNLALLLQQLERKEQAEQEFRNALRINPQAVVARQNLAILLAEQGSYEEAIKLQQAVLAITPGSYRSHRHLGRMYIKLKQFSDAEKALQAALNIAPSPAAYGDLVLLNTCWQRTEKASQAFDRFQNFVGLPPEKQPVAFVDLGRDLREHKQYEMAEKSLRKALEFLSNNKPKQADIYGEIGDMLTARENFAQAAECYKQAVQLLPEDPKQHLRLGQTLAKQSKFDDALRHLREAKKFAGDDELLHAQIAQQLDETAKQRNKEE